MTFQFQSPGSISECVELLDYHKSNARLLAGGTDLVVKLHSRAIQPKVVISLGAVTELSKLKRNDDGSVYIGAMNTLREIIRSNLLSGGFDVIRQAASKVSSMQIRNVATIGGNSCNAAPSADTVPGLIACESIAQIVGPKGERSLPLEGFFTGPGQTVLSAGEILAGFHVPPSLPGTGGVYKKYSIRENTELAIVGVAARLTLNKDRCVQRCRLVLGAVAPTPLRVQRAEQLLLGCRYKKELIEKVAQVAAEDSRPISDQRSTAQYRREMVRIWVCYAIDEAFQRAYEDIPPED